MGNYNFDADLKHEETIKNEVTKFLSKKGYKLLHDNNDNKYDLEVEHIKSGRVTKIELKEDIRCKSSGNVAVEYFCRGKDSGINTTQSDYYLEIIHYDMTTRMYVIIPVKRLKELVTEKEYRNVTGGDEGSYTKMYLIPKEDIIAAGKVIRKYRVKN